jgi:hypothetical protein
MQRPDVHMIKRAMKSKGKFAPTDEGIKYSLTLPFFHFAYKQHMELEWMKDEYLPGGGTLTVNDPNAKAHIFPNEWMFPEFVLTFQSRGVESRHEITVINGLDECRNEQERSIMIEDNIDTMVYVWTWDFGVEADGEMFISSVFVVEEDGTFRGGPASANGRGYGYEQRDIDLTDPLVLKDEGNRLLLRTLKDSVGGLLTSVQMMHNWLKVCERHPVSVTPTSRPKPSPLDKKRPWRRATGPSILLLDKMPSQATESTGTGSSKRPHRRRGHWRTLSHPKYRHHPQYQQKIWVKPSFIGPLEEVHEGNMYRLIDQGHGMLLH